MPHTWIIATNDEHRKAQQRESGRAAWGGLRCQRRFDAVAWGAAERIGLSMEARVRSQETAPRRRLDGAGRAISVSDGIWKVITNR